MKNLKTYNQLFERHITVELEMTSLEGLKLAVEEGEDINEIDDLYFETPLTMSIRSFFSEPMNYRPEWFEIIEYLISAGADVNKKDDYKNTPLLTSVKRSKNRVNMKIIRLLTDNGADWLIRATDGDYFIDKLNSSYQEELKELYPDKYNKYIKAKSARKFKI